MHNDNEYKKVKHPFSPIYDENSSVLILGSMPSVKSAQLNFYYGHSRNRFWYVLSKITNSSLPSTIEQKKSLLLKNGIALWDVLQSCTIIGSDDSSIKDPVCNDFSVILNNCNIKAVFTNGRTADKLYKKFSEDKTGLKSICLPSTSPANAKYQNEELVEIWSKLLLF